jgi:chromosome segregation ATPase
MSTLDAVQLIATWKERLAAISANAYELSESESTKRVRIRTREGHYQGMTKQCAEQAIVQISRLRDDYLLLARLVDEAEQAHQAGLFTSRESRDEKVVTLLCSPSIARATGTVPIARRTLLGSASHIDQITPDQLLAIMQSEFESARDLLNRIGSVEGQGHQQLNDLRRDYAGMEERAARLKAGSDRPSFIELQELQSDPLNAQAGIESLKRGLQAWSASLDELEQLRAGAQETVSQAKASLKTSDQLHQDYQSQLTRFKQLFGEAAATTLKMTPGNPLEMLASWCATLESLLQAGQWNAVNVGGSRLNAALVEAIGNVNRAIAEIHTRCAEADELKGQFTALKAKEKSMSGVTTASQTTMALRAQIDAALKARPLSIDGVRTLLQKYQQIMLAAGRH